IENCDNRESIRSRDNCDIRESIKSREGCDTRDNFDTRESIKNREVYMDREDHESSKLGLQPIYVDILRILVDGGSPEAIIKDKHLMASIVADTINDRLFDEIGDIVVVCEDDRLLLIDEYKEDIADLLT
ncbi:MAG: hypothetical protein J6Y90_07220, partial [Lachnospiraceae bacterium]|nr:hypothetical protein [Lachnospiraceae bacterium]